MFNEDNSGFINFPYNANDFVAIDSGKTLVYIICFDIFKKSKLSKMENINLFSPGVFVSDDVIARPNINIDNQTLDSFIIEQKQQDEYDKIYFPNAESEEYWKKQMSINLVSSVCVGWANQTFEYKNDIRFWNATFRDLTPDGKNLYYSLKKLHNNKEVRILTFSTT